MTTKCNMSCEHCCFDYGNGKPGKNMDIQTFTNALKFAKNYDMYVTLGGGEITLHPSYKKFVNMAIESTKNDSGLFIVTNGSMKVPTTWLLERMEEEHSFGNDLFNVEMSYDDFHDKEKVDDSIYNQFKRLNKIRNTSKYGKLMNVGRAVNLDHSYELFDSCVCEDLSIYPDGSMKWCGCPDAPIIGNINFDDELPSDYNNECHKTRELIST